MERRWLISAMAAMAMLSAPALADDKGAEEEAPPAPGAPVAEAPAVPAPAPEEEKKDTAPVEVAQNTPATQPGAPGAPAEEKTPDPPAAPKFTYGGYADFYFSSNFNNPDPAFNTFAAYDFKDEHGPHLNYIELWAQYARDPIGFRLDIGWGPGGRITNFLERTISRDDVWDHVQQAYVSANLTKNGRTYADFGRWVTPVGAEVIDSRDNWLYSRGLIFNLSGPFTHTGLKLNHYFNDTDFISGYVTTGWDRVSFINDAGPGFGITGSKVISPKLTLSGSYMGGEEPDFFGGVSYRNFFDIVAAYNASSKWAFTGNFELGEQSGSMWYGLSAQARYNVNAKSFAAARVEFLTDEDGVRFGTGSNETAYSFTIGYTYNWNKHFQTRAEYRHDFFTDDVFLKNRTGLADDQGRFIIAAVLGY